ncbi:MAG: hypothetical protein JWM81_195 [Candidatus Saccharibacteria bacterium]|nr:hypothetical protein [Candidatus Saccharibacteria bacterium]
MAQLWVPEQTPPQLADTVRQELALQIQEDGIVRTAAVGLSRLQETQAPLAHYVDEYIYTHAGKDGQTSSKMLMSIGASLAFLAYAESGFDTVIDVQTLEMAKSIAELDGIPESYVCSVQEDATLRALLDETLALTRIGGFNNDLYSHGVAEIGAGCVRFFLQQVAA